MLIRFSVENFLSFKDNQVFSMAAGLPKRHKDHTYTINENRILKSSFFFGANASGKSNLIKAIDFARRMVKKGLEEIRYSDRPFRIDDSYLKKPGIFEFDLFSNKRFYSYGFSVLYEAKAVDAEWLYLQDGNHEIKVFERIRGEKIKTDLTLTDEDLQRFKIYSEDITDQELLLSEVAEKNLPEDGAFSAFFDVYKWFSDLVIIFPKTHYRRRQIFEEGYSVKELPELLSYFDTGIENIKEESRPIEEVLAFVPKEVRADIVEEVEKLLPPVSERGSIKKQVIVGIGSNIFAFQRKGNGLDIIAKQMGMDHGNPQQLFSFLEESDGTQRLFDLIPLYAESKQGKTIFIDELDRSFHAKLTREFIKKYFEYSSGYASQLIVTTHDANLMDLNLLRQDEIWFIERQKDHSSRLYSLNQYQARYDKIVLKDYLLGRYGAIPCFDQSELQED